MQMLHFKENKFSQASIPGAATFIAVVKKQLIFEVDVNIHAYVYM